MTTTIPIREGSEMAERLADIVAQIQNVHQLEAVVTAMRGIAASRAQQSRSLVAGIEAHAKVVAGAIGQALSLLPPEGSAPAATHGAARGLILFAAEQGFAGAFTERVLDAAAGQLAGAAVFIVGTRGIALARDRGIAPVWSTAAATHSGAIPVFANRLSEALYDRVADGMTRVDIFFPISLPGRIAITRRSLLPLDLAAFPRPSAGQAPLVSLEPQVLLERLAAEYVYAEICEAAMHAFAAENEARMLAMSAAKGNIESKLAGLGQRERQLRQEEITTEIIELVAGAEVIGR